MKCIVKHIFKFQIIHINDQCYIQTDEDLR